MPQHLRFLPQFSDEPAEIEELPIEPSHAAVAAVVSSNGHAAVADLPLNLEEVEALLIQRAMAETGGNIAEAARRLGVNRTRIYRRLGGQA